MSPSPLVQVGPAGATTSPDTWPNHPDALSSLGDKFQSPPTTHGFPHDAKKTPRIFKYSTLGPVIFTPSFKYKETTMMPPGTMALTKAAIMRAPTSFAPPGGNQSLGHSSASPTRLKPANFLTPTRTPADLALGPSPVRMPSDKSDLKP